MPQVDDTPVSIEEEDVDRKTHSYRVNGLRRNDEKAGAGFEVASSKQAYEPAQTCAGDPDPVPQHRVPSRVKDGDRLGLHAIALE